MFRLGPANYDIDAWIPFSYFSGTMRLLLELTGNALLFALVFGMSATVDTSAMQHQVRNKSAILLGLFCQFILLPLLGYLVVSILDLAAPVGITLLVVTSSPGGSYSNW